MQVGSIFYLMWSNVWNWWNKKWPTLLWRVLQTDIYPVILQLVIVVVNFLSAGTQMQQLLQMTTNDTVYCPSFRANIGCPFIRVSCIVPNLFFFKFFFFIREIYSYLQQKDVLHVCIPILHVILNYKSVISKA